jgi:uncharacterized protein YkwD
MTTAARFRYTLVAGATAVVIGAGFTVAGVSRGSPEAAADRSSADVPLTAPQPPIFPEDAGLLPSEDAASATVSAAPSATTSSPAPAATTRRPAAKPRRTATSRPATSRPGPRPAAPQTSGSVIDRVLSHINAARADEDLPAYTLDSDLSRAAALHNQRMIDGCGLDHQCSGEGGIGDRFSAQGVQWRSAGENIGFGSSGASNAAIVGAANRLTDSMLAETPPDDGHRRNLLSRDFERIGLSVVRDDGRVWLTQDFVG